MRRNLLLLLDLFSIFLRASSQPAEPRDTFVGNLQQKYNETVSRNVARNFACSRTPIGSYYSSHYAAVDLNEHPEACGRCLRATCVDRTQCRSPFLNVTVAVLDDCPGCGEGAVAMNSLAVRELTGRSRLEEENEEDLQVEWELFECSATTQVSVPPSPSPSSPPPAPMVVLAAPAPEEEAPAPPAPMVALAAPAPEEEAPAPPAPMVVLAAPAPEEEAPAPPAPMVVLAAPAPEEETLLVVTVDPAVVVTTPPAIEEEEEEEKEEENISQLPIGEAPPAPYPPPPPPPQAISAPALEVEFIQQPPPQQEEEQPLLQENNQQKQQNEVETEAVYGLPGDNVLSLPRVGKIGLAVPVDYQPFPEQAFANIACGFGSVSTHFKTHFAALASFLGQNENACGSCLAVRCADPSKCPYGTETVMQVVDTCGSCGVNDVNISPDALKSVMGGDELGDFSDIRVTWKKVACRGKTEGSMYLQLLHGATDNEYYAQMSLSNAAQEISKVHINGQSLLRMSAIGGGRWEWKNNGNKLNLTLPAVLEVAGMDGKVMKMELQKFESQELPLEVLCCSHLNFWAVQAQAPEVEIQPISAEEAMDLPAPPPPPLEETVVSPIGRDNGATVAELGPLPSAAPAGAAPTAPAPAPGVDTTQPRLTEEADMPLPTPQNVTEPGDVTEPASMQPPEAEPAMPAAPTPEQMQPATAAPAPVTPPEPMDMPLQTPPVQVQADAPITTSEAPSPAEEEDDEVAEPAPSPAPAPSEAPPVAVSGPREVAISGPREVAPAPEFANSTS